MQRQPGFLQGIMLLLPITMAVMGVSLLTAVVPLMYAHFREIPNYAYLIQGGVMTMPSIWIVLFSPVAGWLADRFGRRNILLAAMTAYAFVGIAPTFLDSLNTIILSRVGVGICESIVMTVSTTMICDYFSGKSRERWLAGQTATASTAALLIIPLGGFLASRYGWRGPFYLYLYSLLLVAGVWLFIWEPVREGTGLGASSSSTGESAATSAFPWARMLSQCGLTIIAAVMFYSIITQNGNALAALGVHDPSRIGLLTMIASLGVPIGTFGYWIASRLPIGRLLCLDFALIGAGFYGMGHAGAPADYVAFAFVNQVGCGLVLPTMLVWTTRDLPFAIRGRGNGMWQGAFAIGQFVSGMVLQLLGDQFGGRLLPAFSVLSAICVVVAVVALLGALTRGRGATALAAH
ncbi:MAG: MFS transporter [Steroidobacteraceae bacterium]